MTLKSILSLACLTTALVTAPALAGEPVVLRETLTVNGPHVTLGDLFDTVDAEAAAAVVARAPEPGARTSLDVAYVQRVAARHDLDWANAAGVRRVTVARASRQIDGAMIADMLEGELFASEGRVHDVQLSNSALVLHAPVDSPAGLMISAMNYDVRSGLLTAEIATHAGAEPVRVTGRAYATLDVPVLGRAVAAGTEITASDIEWVSVRADRVRPDAVLDPEALIGFETRRMLRAGEPVRSYDLQRPMMVERGELVTLIFEAPGIQLSVRARAMENAADGELARFVNLQSNRTVEALVDGPGRARVGFSPAASF